MSDSTFHVGIATDPICADWKAICVALEYLTRNRKAAGDTIMLHDVTPWGSTKLALLWGTAYNHPVAFTPAKVHLQYNSAVAIYDDLHSRQLLNALVIFHNDTNPVLDNISTLRSQIGITARDINAEMAQLIAHTTQHGLPTRVIPYDEHANTQMSNYPIVVLEHDTGKSEHPGLKTGRFYAPQASYDTAKDYLNNAIGNYYQYGRKRGEYTLDTLERNSSWWNYSMHRN
ncbi:MAG: hypothetical protein U0X20_16940 [Caldilineaceae bacterium]